MFGKNVLKSREHAQSAMEYLMTYGWAILIIAIVLAILFKLGVFSGASLTGTSCIGTVGWSCSGLSLSGSGLSFTLGQSTGSTIYNTVVACASSAGSNGYAINGVWYNPTNTLAQFGPATAAPSGASIISIPNGGTVSVSALPCYSSSGQITFGTIGQTFQGYVWVAYQTTPGGTYQVQQALTVSAKETS